MGPEETVAAYRAALSQDGGETVVLRRLGGGGTVVAETDPLLARVSGYKPEELIGSITQGDLRVILLAADVEASGFPLPMLQAGADRVVVRGRSLQIQGIDDNTRRIGAVLIAYQLQVRG